MDLIDAARADNTRRAYASDWAHFETFCERLDIAPNGDRSWSGHLYGYGDEYSVVFTQGETLSFATIQTPDGVFLLEGQGDRGWIFRDTLDELIDPSKTDVIHVEDL